jgi:hypothetical protein
MATFIKNPIYNREQPIPEARHFASKKKHRQESVCLNSFGKRL